MTIDSTARTRGWCCPGPELWEGAMQGSGRNVFKAEGAEPVFINLTFALEPQTLCSLTSTSLPFGHCSCHTQPVPFALLPFLECPSSSSLSEITLQNPVEMSDMTHLPTHLPPLMPSPQEELVSLTLLLPLHDPYSNIAPIALNCRWFV